MGCLFSKTAAEDGLLAGAPPPTASDAGGGLAPGEAAVAAEPAAAASDGVTFNSRPTAIASSSSPDVLKPMGRGGFADITTGIQEQLGSWKAPLNPSETGEEGTRYVTNENASELKLGATLGKGNYGVVHAATWRDREVAVKKVLMPENMRAEQQRRLVEDFKCEVDICCRLTHPRLVAFLGYTTAPDLCIVQELMQQGSLYDQFQRGWRANTLQQQLVLAHDVARGMAYLHAWRPPLIHRDLKSLNILLSAGEKDASGVAMARCKVTDFGMTRAKALGQPTAEDTAAAGGTPFWTAPEIIEGSTYNEKVDQYAYGCLCLEILTGAPPWQTAAAAGSRAKGGQQMSPLKVMQMVVQGQRPALPPETPRAFAGLITKCWAQDPAQRPGFKQIVSHLKAVAKEKGFVLPRD